VQVIGTEGNNLKIPKTTSIQKALQINNQVPPPQGHKKFVHTMTPKLAKTGAIYNKKAVPKTPNGLSPAKNKTLALHTLAAK